MSSTSRRQATVPTRNRFQSYLSGQAQNERMSMGANGVGHFRQDSEGNTSDSANEVENMLGLQGRQNHRVPLKQPGAGMSRLPAQPSLNRHARRGFSFGQTTPRGQSLVTDIEENAEIWRL
jgi:hypothetical protein